MGADLGYLGGGVCSQGSAGYVLQLTPGDGRDEVQVVGLMELVPQVLGGKPLTCRCETRISVGVFKSLTLSISIADTLAF